MKRVALGALVAVLVSSSAWAWGGRGGHGMMHEGPGMKMHRLEVLNLTADQREKMLALHREYDPRLDALHVRMRDSQRAIRDARIQGKEPDAAQTREMEGLRMEMQKLREEMHLKMAAFLTPEQKAKLPTERPGRGR